MAEIRNTVVAVTVPLETGAKLHVQMLRKHNANTSGPVHILPEEADLITEALQGLKVGERGKKPAQEGKEA